jgi:hypothetical protein
MRNGGDGWRALAYNEMPSFVYYTNYGDLESEIYLPNVIDNLAREDLGAKEQAKVSSARKLSMPFFNQNHSQYE